MVQKEQNTIHFPTLKTLLAIESTIKDAGKPISRTQILAALPTKVMRSTLNTGLDYLEKRGIIKETEEGFVWTLGRKKGIDKTRASDLILEKIRENRPRLSAYHLKNIGLFGSYAKGEEKESSDIDILVEFMPGYKTFDNYMNLKFFLEKVLGKKIDLVIKEAVKSDLKKEILESVMYAT